MAKRTSNGKVKLDNKKLCSLIASTILVIVIVAFATYYWESGTNIAETTQFSKTSGGQTPDQVLYRFSEKVENRRTNDINDLILRVRILGDGIQIGSEDYILRSLLRRQGSTSDDVPSG